MNLEKQLEALVREHGIYNVTAAFRDAVGRHLDNLCALPVERLLEERYAKFRAFGDWHGPA